MDFHQFPLQILVQAVLKVKCPDGSPRAQLDLPDDLPEVFLTLSLESFEQAPALGMDEGQQPLSWMEWAWEDDGLF